MNLTAILIPVPRLAFDCSALGPRVRRAAVMSIAALTLAASGCSPKGDGNPATANASGEPVASTAPSGPSDSSSSSGAAAANQGSYSTKPSAVLKTVDEVKRWSAGVESLEQALGHLDKTCGGVKPAVDINYESFASVLGTDDLPSVAHVVGHCEAAIAGVSSQCGWKDEVLESAIRANLQRVLCEFDESADSTVVLSWKDGVYRAGFRKISENVHSNATQWVTRNVPPAP